MTPTDEPQNPDGIGVFADEQTYSNSPRISLTTASCCVLKTLGAPQ